MIPEPVLQAVETMGFGALRELRLLIDVAWDRALFEACHRWVPGTEVTWIAIDPGDTAGQLMKGVVAYPNEKTVTVRASDGTLRKVEPDSLQYFRPERLKMPLVEWIKDIEKEEEVTSK